MSGEKILVIEDEQDISDLIRYNLEREGHSVIQVTSGEKGLTEARKSKPQLILLDLMLPGIDGLQVCRGLKSEDITRDIPVIILTAKSEEADIVAGLELGADDYITKPFSPRVLLARLRAVLRRKAEAVIPDGRTIVFRNLRIDPGKHLVSVGGKTIALTHTEFNLIHVLARRPGWVFTRNQLVDAIRGEDVFITDRTIDVHVAGLRKKLGKGNDFIETIRGVGYRFKES
jgi:two-component system phosphate regulon response regulator PhoB